MNTLLLEPTDVLFFKDGRPMSGSLSGHGAAWPLPTVTNAALHAALHRAEIEGVHAHRRGRNRNYSKTRDRKFGSLLTAGPFPVNPHGQWHFPRPLDAHKSDSTELTFHPLQPSGPSSLPEPLQFPVASQEQASKDTPAPWWNAAAWMRYLDPTDSRNPADSSRFLCDSAFSDTEHNYGIGIDATTGTQNGEQFYSASYLRLKPGWKLGWKLGLLAETQDKIHDDSANKRDLIENLFPSSGIIVGGQQRICTVTRQGDQPLPLPVGKSAGFTQHEGKWRVKWVLLTPAIFPQINDHPGGWLPSWIRHSDGKIMLKSGDTKRREREGREAWRTRAASLPDIAATACEVAQHVRISDETDTAEAGGLFNQENVPADTLFYSVLSATKSRVPNGDFKNNDPNAALLEFAKKVESAKVFQFGGDASTGLGFCSVTTSIESQGK